MSIECLQFYKLRACINEIVNCFPVFPYIQSESLAEKKQQEEVLTKEIENSTIRMAEVNEELNKIVGELQNARIDYHEGRRQRMRAEILESLKRLYPDSVVIEWCHLKALFQN